MKVSFCTLIRLQSQDLWPETLTQTFYFYPFIFMEDILLAAGEDFYVFILLVI